MPLSRSQHPSGAMVLRVWSQTQGCGIVGSGWVELGCVSNSNRNILASGPRVLDQSCII